MTARSCRLKMFNDSIFLFVSRYSATRLSVSDAIFSTRFCEAAPSALASSRSSMGASSCCAETASDMRQVAALASPIAVALKLVIQSLLDPNAIEPDPRHDGAKDDCLSRAPGAIRHPLYQSRGEMADRSENGTGRRRRKSSGRPLESNWGAPGILSNLKSISKRFFGFHSKSCESPGAKHRPRLLSHGRLRALAR